MRILHVINSMSLKSGGPPRSLIPIANYQSKKHEVTVISSSNETFKREKFNYINIFFIIKRFSFPRLNSIKTLYKSIDESEYIHIHNWWNFLSTLTLIFSYLLKKKLIITPHGSLHKFNIKKSIVKKLLLHYLIEIFFIHNIKGIHYLTKNELENCFFKKLKIKKIIISNSINIDDIKLNISYENDYLLYMGRLAKNKNINFIIDVVDQLFKDHNKIIDLIIIGPDYGERKNLVSKIKNLDLIDRIKILEPIYSSERYSYIKNAKALLLASDYECNSIVVAEALALGVIVISSKECNTDEIAQYGGCISIEKNKFLFASQINEILKQDHNKIKIKAKQYSIEFLDLKKNVIKLNEFYLKF